MHPGGYEGWHESGCRGLLPRVGAIEPEPCARLVVLHHRRHRSRAERLVPRLATLCDSGQSVASRFRAASDFTRDLDALFAEARVVPSRRLHELVAAYDTVFHEHLLPGLAADGVTFVRPEHLPPVEQEQVRRHLRRSIQPLLTPMAIGPTHPTLTVPALTLNLAVRVGHRLVYLTVPSSVPRVMTIRGGRYLAVESLVAAFLPDVLVDVPVSEYSAFRITRCATDDRINRLEIERTAGDDLVHELAWRLGVDRAHVFRMRSSLAIGQVFAGAPISAQGHRSGPALRATGFETETIA